MESLNQALPQPRDADETNHILLLLVSYNNLCVYIYFDTLLCYNNYVYFIVTFCVGRNDRPLRASRKGYATLGKGELA